MSKVISATNPFIVRLPLSEPKRNNKVWSATVAFDLRGDKIYAGVALRSPKDVYDGNFGDRIAIGRAKKKPSWCWDISADGLPEEIQFPNIPVDLYRLWAIEVAFNFVIRNIRYRYEKVLEDLGLPAVMKKGTYVEQEAEIVQRVYG